MRYASDGWISSRQVTADDADDDTSFGVHVRVRRDEDGRLIITDVYVHSSEITNEILRSLSIPRMQASLSANKYVRVPASADEDEDYELTLHKLRQRTRGETRPSDDSERQREALQRPDGTGPEAFYELVSQAYLEYAAESKAPARGIAEEAQVPTTTAHRWVREARRRGYLPEGRKGQVL